MIRWLAEVYAIIGCTVYLAFQIFNSLALRMSLRLDKFKESHK